MFGPSDLKRISASHLEQIIRTSLACPNTYQLYVNLLTWDSWKSQVLKPNEHISFILVFELRRKEEKG